MKEERRDGGIATVVMGEGRLRREEGIDRENRLNQGGCVLVTGAKGEGEVQPQWLSGKHAGPSDYCIPLAAIAGPHHVY